MKIQMNKHLSVLVDGKDILLFAEIAKGSDYLRRFCFDLGIECEVGHGSKEMGTYKDFTVAFMRAI
jgi:hypothetical protein